MLRVELSLDSFPVRIEKSLEMETFPLGARLATGDELLSGFNSRNVKLIEDFLSDKSVVMFCAAVRNFTNLSLS